MPYQENLYEFRAIGPKIIEETLKSRHHRIKEFPIRRKPSYTLLKAFPKPPDPGKENIAQGIHMDNYLPTLSPRERRVKRTFAPGGAPRKALTAFSKW